MKSAYQFVILSLVIFVLQACTFQNHEERKAALERQKDSMEQRIAEIKDSLRMAGLNRSVVPMLGDVLDSNDVEGSILIYKMSTDTWVSNDYNWAEERRLPASTYKIVNSIIGLETGVVSAEGVEFKWDGRPRRMKQWERDFDLRGAFHASCVPCYQQLARKIGVERMTRHLTKFDYGDMNVDSTSLDVFWLSGESGVSQVEQIEFLKKFYTNTLGISESTTKKMKDLMVIDSTDEYVLSGKTGWAIRDGHNNGWFVGYLEVGEEVYFFATNVDPKEAFNMKLFPKIRSAVTMEAFRRLGMIE